MFVISVLSVALIAHVVNAFNLPHLPQNLKTLPQIAKATSCAIVGATLAFGGVNLVESAFSSSSIAVVNAKETKSVFEGQYNDPNHPGCLRKITSKGNIITIIGSDELDGSKQWVIQAKEDFPGTIFVDFTSKGGPPDLLGE